MDNFLESLKVRNTFNNLFKPQVQAPQPIMPEPEQPNILQELLTPQNQANGRLEQMLNSMPQREDYQPSPMTNFFSRIAGLGVGRPAGISGGQPIGYIGNPAEGMNVINAGLNRGFNQAMGDYMTQLKPISELADSERAINTNNRLTAATLLRDEKANKDRESREGIASDKLDLEKDRLAQKREYAAIIKAKNEMPNAALAEDKDGKVYTWDRKTGQFISYLLNENGDVVESSKLPEQEKLQIQQNNRLQQIAAQGSQSRQTVALQGKNAIENTEARGEQTRQNITARGSEQRQTNAAKPAVTSKSNPTGKRVTVVDPKGNAYTLPEEQLSAFMKKNSGWTVK